MPRATYEVVFIDILNNFTNSQTFISYKAAKEHERELNKKFLCETIFRKFYTARKERSTSEEEFYTVDDYAVEPDDI